VYVLVAVSSQVGSNRVDHSSASQENSKDDHAGSFLKIIFSPFFFIENAILLLSA